MYEVDLKASSDELSDRTKLRAPCAVLLQIFGPPAKTPPKKSSTRWTLRADADPADIIEVRDSHDEDELDRGAVRALRGLPSYDWRISARDDESARRFCEWLSALVVMKLAEVKSLGPDAKAKVNELMASGMSLTDALKQVPVQSPEQLATRFAWPIKAEPRRR